MTLSAISRQQSTSPTGKPKTDHEQQRVQRLKYETSQKSSVSAALTTKHVTTGK
jgi:hypothetical protein